MVSPADQQVAYARLADLSESDLRALLTKMDLSRPDRLREPLTVILAGLGDKYGAAAASLAADIYDTERAAANAKGRFSATPAELPGTDRFDALAGYGIGPLYSETPDPESATNMLSGGLSRVVMNAARDTVLGAVDTDPAAPFYARHASANACAFCRMLATRGADYTSAESAMYVGGRGTSEETNVGRTRGRMALGVRPRGTQAIGEKFHDHCHCTVVPVFSLEDYEPAPYVKDWEEQYGDAHVTHGKYGAVDLKQTLANWREQTGAR